MARETLTFLDLPPEIRNEIYTLLLPADRKVLISKWFRRLEATAINGDSLRGLTRLLRTNRHLREEVASLLYGVLTFKIHPSQGGRRWLRKIGPMKQHLRHIFLEEWTKTNMRSVFHQLKQARFLGTITLSYAIWTCDLRSPRAAAVAEALKPFMKSLDVVQRGESDEDHLLNVVRVEVPPFGPSVDAKCRARVERNAEDYTAGIRSQLKKLLV